MDVDDFARGFSQEPVSKGGNLRLFGRGLGCDEIIGVLLVQNEIERLHEMTACEFIVQERYPADGDADAISGCLQGKPARIEADAMIEIDLIHACCAEPDAPLVIAVKGMQ